MQQLFSQLGSIRCPVLGLFGDQDQTIPIETVLQFDTLLTQFNIPHEINVYPDSGHAFFRDTDPNVHKPEAAKDAWLRVTRFFRTNLGQSRRREGENPSAICEVRGFGLIACRDPVVQ